MKSPAGRVAVNVSKNRIRRSLPRGFALIITLSLMVLLVILAVGLLTLSSKSLATSGRESDLAEARANARLALALAIGQLQKEAGPDQRISAAADQLTSGADGSNSAAAEGRNHWTGIYDSWASDEDTRPDPSFRGWLVSGDTADVTSLSTARGSAAEEIELVGEGTVGPASDGTVKVPPLKVESTGGQAARLGWWTGDQGIKAALAIPVVPGDSSLAMVRTTLQAAPRNAIEFAGGGKPFEGLDPADPRLTAVTDWKQSAFLAADIESPRELFHDLAPYSTGLLTNVREGGFRKDLSMQLERPVPVASRMALYKVRGETGINFQELRTYYNLYKELQTRGGPGFTTGGRIGRNSPYLQVDPSPSACQNDEEFFHKQPVIISYQMVLSFETRMVSGRARLHVVADPVVTFWNPHDVPVAVPQSSFFSIKYWQVPYDLVISGRSNVRYPLAASLSGAFSGSNGDGNYLSMQAGAAQQLVFKPGEVIKVSQSGSTFVGNPGNHTLPGKAGFNYGGGVSLPVRDTEGGYVDLPANATFSYQLRPNNLTAGKKNGSGNTVTGADAHSRHFSLMHNEYYIGADRGSNSLGIGGMYIDWDFGNRRLMATESRGESQPGTKRKSERLYANVHSDIFRPILSQDTRPLTVGELSGRKAPFMLLSFNAKTEMGSDLGTRYLARFNPTALHVDFYDLSERERDLLPYEFTVEPLLSWKNRSLEVSTNGNAYFGGSMDAEFGNSFVTTHSVPREPIVSLAALQHSCANGFEFQKPKYGYATLNAREPMLPQIAHAIGNSMAPSVIPSGETEGSLPGGRPLADHSYLANRALWDDWFFSGIAPQSTTGFGSRRSQRQVGEEFLEGTGKLPVARYLPDRGGVDTAAVLGDFFAGSIPSDAAVRNAASLIRVDGLFNVNSTSVEAWKAMLGSLKGRPVVTRDATGAETLEAGDSLVPVASLHAPFNEVVDGNGNLDVKEPGQWIGRRVLTEAEIESLARAIVREVRKRGPFLSLADFVNRRVGIDDLARAGAIQSALDADDVPINSAFRSGGRGVSGTTASRFAYPDAEMGPGGFGSPGIVKQADILTPIAPVLSARSDSFIVRAYGESVDREGKVLARAWCEATVERDKNFIDPDDAPETALTNLGGEVNKTFGRRFQMSSFRWLHPGEI